jgi:hypothetical protein
VDCRAHKRQAALTSRHHLHIKISDDMVDACSAVYLDGSSTLFWSAPAGRSPARLADVGPERVILDLVVAVHPSGHLATACD